MSFIGSLIEPAIENVASLKRLASKVSVSLNDGLGLYLFSMSLLGIAAFFAWRAWEAGDPERMKLHALEQLLPMKQEPLRDEHVSGFTGTVLMNVEGWNVCDLDDNTSATADEAARLFQELYRMRQPTRATGSYPLLTAMAPQQMPFKLDPLERWPSPRGDPTPDVGQASSARTNASLVQISSVLNTAQVANRRFDYAIGHSNAISVFQPLVGKRAPSCGSQANLPRMCAPAEDPSAPEFKSFYYVSIDGIFEITPPPDVTLPANQLFNHRSYVAASVANRFQGRCSANGTRYHSLPYLDMIGNGIVATLCYRIMQPARPPSGALQAKLEGPPSYLTNASRSPASEVMSGTFCADLALPRTRIRQALAENPFFKTWLVRLIQTGAPTDPTAIPDVRICGIDPRFDCTQKLSAANASRLIPSEEERPVAEAMARKLYQKLKQPTGDGELIDLGVDASQHRYYGVNLWRSSGPGPAVHEVAILSPVQPGYANYINWGLCVLTCLGVVWAVSSAQRTQDRLRASSMMRSLQVGVLRMRMDGDREIITAANDRAEELLGIELPRLGLPTSLTALPRKPIGFRQLLASPQVIVPRKVHGEKRMEPVDRWDIRDFSDVIALRRKGLHSEYYVQLFAGAETGWFKITGSPILMPDGGKETFGLIEHITDESLCNELRARLDDATSSAVQSHVNPQEGR